jgi:hypothetical protein
MERRWKGDGREMEGRWKKRLEIKLPSILVIFDILG